MIVTARQVEEMHRRDGANGHVTLPYRARLTPLAVDWVRGRKIVLGYSDVETKANSPAASIAPQPQTAQGPAGAGTVLWWCDGPCGPAKAALTAHEKESSLRAIDLAADKGKLLPAIKTIAAEIKAGRARGAVLMVGNGALAGIYANRCPSLRAILGTCMEAVEQGVQQAAANVLIVEYPYKTLPQIKNLLARFTRGASQVPDDVQRQLQELASCG